MTREDIYECWAPAASAWSLWARPILFAQMPSDVGELPGRQAWRELDVSWAAGGIANTVVVVDLPGDESVNTGLALVGQGYRPVPLYNACTGPHEVIPQGPIITALQTGAPYLAALASTAAPPAFLLDSRRMNPGGPIQPRAFDNRWQVFPQDFPSANFLTDRGLTRVLLIQRGRTAPPEDLAHVLRRWRDAGMTVEARDVDSPTGPVPITVNRPPWYRSVWQRVLAILGLRRGSQGGFGRADPEPSHG